jgi:hypothetical protein
VIGNLRWGASGGPPEPPWKSLKGKPMYIRKIAAVAGFATGAALALAPFASADTSSDWLSSIDSLLGGAGPALAAPAVSDFQISFNGTDLFPTLGN